MRRLQRVGRSLGVYVIRRPVHWTALLAIVASLSPVMTPMTRAECPYLCGDYNLSGAATSADFFELTSWQYQGFQPPSAPDSCWNVDGHAVVTNRDLVFLVRSVWGGTTTLECDSLLPELPVAPSPHFYFVHETIFPAGDSITELNIDIVHRLPLAGASLGFQVKVGDQSAWLDTESGGLPYAYVSGWIGKGNWNSYPRPDGGLFGFATSASATFPPGRRPFLSTIRVHMPPAPYDRSLELLLVDQDTIVIDPRVDRTSQVVDSAHNIWTLGIGPSDCPYELPGDTDASGSITSTDIILLVNYVFKAGAEPLPCPPNDDVNCDLAVTASDIIALVNHVFKGYALCDPCMEWLFPWGCL